MANKKSLKPFTSEQSREKAVINGRKGGISSGIAKRKRKTLKEELLLLLESEEIQKKISTALINEAINGNNAGSVTKAFEVIRDTIGEKPIDKVMVSDVDANVINEVERMVNDDEETSS
jgi:hypothetical protein